MELNKKLILVLILILISLALLIYFWFFSESNDFRVNTVVLKSVLKLGEETSSNIRITNLRQERNFQLSLNNLGIANLTKKNFVLKEGESKEINLTLRSDYFQSIPGIYTDRLSISTDSSNIEVPIIVEVQSKVISFVTNLEVSPEYKEVGLGEKISVGIKIYNLEDTNTHILKLTSVVKNLDNERIVLETENVAVGSETLITKTIALPEEVPYGNYVFAVVADFESENYSSVSTSSYLFSVGGRKNAFRFDSNLFIIVFSIIILIFLFGIIALVFYLIRERDVFFLELKKQHKEEMEFYLNKVEKIKQDQLSKTRESKRKKRIKFEFRKIRESAIKKIREKYKKQKKILIALKKQKKPDEMKRKLEGWKKQGFNTREFTEIYKPVNVTKKQVERWKKQGYK